MRVFALALGCVLLSCQPEGGAAAPPAAAAPAREPTFADRTKQADYNEARALLGEVLSAGRAGVDAQKASELGFKCASLRGAQKKLASETDPLVVRLLADIEKTCGLDLPLASAQIEILQIEAKRKAEGSSASIKGQCIALKLAIGDVGPAYITNPDVVDVGGKYATLCADQPP